MYESSSGVVFKIFGNEKVQPKYEGEITNGEANGFGILTYPNNEKNVVGEWKNGKEWNSQTSLNCHAIKPNGTRIHYEVD